MKIIFLGTGWPVPNPDRVGSSQLLEIAGRYYLIDCGNNATTQMVRAGVNPLAVNRVFFSHLHYDHVADFAYFVLSGWLCNRLERVRLWGPRGTARFCSMLFESGAYKADIESRLLYPFKRANKLAIEVDARDVGAGVIFDEDGVRVTAAFVEHIPGEISPCLAFRVEAEGRAVVFSGDTAPCRAVVDLARGADLLVHECCFPQEVADARRTSGVGHWQHTGPVDLGKIARESGVPRLVMTHIGPVETANETLIGLVTPHLGRQHIRPGMIAKMVDDVRAGYAGEIVVAEDLSVVGL